MARSSGRIVATTMTIASNGASNLITPTPIPVHGAKGIIFRFYGGSGATASSTVQTMSSFVSWDGLTIGSGPSASGLVTMSAITGTALNVTEQAAKLVQVVPTTTTTSVNDGFMVPALYFYLVGNASAANDVLTVTIDYEVFFDFIVHS